VIAIHDELSQLQFVRDLTLETFSELWVLKVSDEEVKFLTGGDPTKDENNLTLFHPGCKLMLVTEGGEGCRYYTPVCQSSFSIVAFCDHPVRFSVLCGRKSCSGNLGCYRVPLLGGDKVVVWMLLLLAISNAPLHQHFCVTRDL
jgi:hypothetical protein